MRATFVLLLTAVLAGSSFPATARPDARDDFFEARIRPLLSRNCYACHTGLRMGGLRLDARDEILKGGKSGPAVVPGDPDGSLLVQAVRHTHARIRMPMDGAKLQPAEIDDLAAWVRAGARWPEGAAPAVAAADRSRITAEQRAFWAFQPVRKPVIPIVKHAAWVRSPIDSFVLAKLEERGLEPAPPADRRTLVRRVYFDLVGLPPAPEEIDRFVSDRNPRAFEELVDRLLASPRYGERWGRYWLDVARYSDDKLDPTGETPYESSFRYRDWVIGAFNDDMPYDLFVKAQIAGDQLDAEQPEKYVPGLGFYALSPQFQDDRVDATTRGFLGLTVACAQCHDHKFDPIPTRDYYSLLGVFKSTEAHDYPIAAPETVRAYDAQKKRVDAQEEAIKAFLKSQAGQLAEILASRSARYLAAAARLYTDAGAAQTVADAERLDRETLDRWLEYLKKPERQHPFLDPWTALAERRAPADAIEREAAAFQDRLLEVAAEKKEIDEKNLITLGGRSERNLLSSASLRSLERDRYFLWRDFFSDRGVLYYSDRKIDRFLSGEWKAHLETMRAELAALKGALPPRYPFLHALRDSREPRNLKVEIRGNPAALGDEAPRRFLEILSSGEPRPFARGSGRLELGEAIASRTNPLTARVMANRIWQHHFGQGIVRTASNFGALGDRPSHPELLDYLASYFVEENWSIKAVHRLLMNSATYAQSYRTSAAAEAIDPENRLLWRASRRRLDVESLRDALLEVAGNLDVTMGGIARRLTDDNRRRTVYGFVSRKKLDPMLGLFDFANPNNTSEARIATNVPLQRLFLSNSPFVMRQAAAIAARLHGANDEAKIEDAYRIVLGRPPSRAELRLGLEFLGRGAGSWEAYAQVLATSNEFLFID